MDTMSPISNPIMVAELNEYQLFKSPDINFLIFLGLFIAFLIVPSFII